MKSLRLHRLCKTASVFLRQEIHTNHVLLARRGKRTPIPQHEPGSKFRDRVLAEETNVKGLKQDFEDEDDYDEDFDFMNVDRAFDEDRREQKRRKQKLGQIITAKKFFESRPQPSMLTYHERECIKYLHKQDPVQWDVKTLSESFPATTEVISKILKSKWKVTPERAKNIDSRVQRNWELLAEGKLDADPRVIEHLKKFVNRREVILEQIKKENFYLPEIKKQEVFNNGEISSILSHYERQVKQLERKGDEKKRNSLIGSGMPDKGRSANESAIESLHKKISKVASKKDPQEKDSFMLGEMLNHYAREKTLDELESEVLQKAENTGKVGQIEQAILDSKLGKPTHKDYKDKPENISPSRIQGKVKQSLDEDKAEMVSSAGKRVQGKVRQSLNTGGREIRQSNRDLRYSNTNSVKIQSEMHEEEDMNVVDSRTLRADEANVGKLLNQLQNSPKDSGPPRKDSPKKQKIKKEIDFSDPERLERENAFYNREVDQIKNTSFWNSGRSSEEKALAESRKSSRDALGYVAPAENLANMPVFSTDAYPERIKIPASQRGSGLTFRINDCYYDDDGEFLYRVPGMTKTA